jgi:ABC-type sugar transport system permease subunit
MRRSKLSGAAVRNLEGMIFIAPWFIGFLLFMAFPIGYSFYMSFHYVQLKMGEVQTTFVGLKFYDQILLQDASALYNDLFPFLRQSIIMIPIIVVFSLMVAILLNQKFFGRSLFRAIFFLPVIFTTGRLIVEFIAQGEGGLNFLNQYDISGLVQANLPKTWAAPVMRILEQFVLILWYSGVQLLIFLAGRQTISVSIYEAARIDGATPWEVFWKVTFPGMVPFIFLNSIYTVVDLFTFPTNPVLSKINSTDYGFSSALAWIYFVIIFFFLVILIGIFAKLNKGGSRR